MRYQVYEVMLAADGRPAPSVSYSVTRHNIGTEVPVFTAESGGASLTDAQMKTDNLGRIIFYASETDFPLEIHSEFLPTPRVVYAPLLIETQELYSVYGAVGDGITSADNDALQNYINDVIDDPTKGPVFLPGGRFLTDNIEINGPLDIVAAGWTAELVTSPATTLYPIRVLPGVDGVHFEGFALDGNKANIPGDSHVLAAPGVAIMVDGAPGGVTDACKNISFERLKVYNQKRLSLVLQSVQGGYVDKCLIADGERDGCTMYFDSWDIDVTGNQIARCGDDYVAIDSELGASVGHQCKRIKVVHNRMLGPGALGGTRGRGGCVRGGKDIGFHQNIIDGVAQSGIVFGTANSTDLDGYWATENTIRGVGGGADQFGIWIHVNDPADHSAGLWAHAKDGYLDENHIESPVDSAIALWDSRTGGPVDGDAVGLRLGKQHIKTPGQYGIRAATAGFSDIELEENFVEGAGVDGYSFPFGKRVHFKGNKAKNNTGKGFDVDGVDGGSFRGNDAWDDRGAGALQTIGMRLNALSGNWVYGEDNRAWGNVTAQKQINPNSHTADFADGEASLATRRRFGAGIALISTEPSLASFTGNYDPKTNRLVDPALPAWAQRMAYTDNLQINRAPATAGAPAFATLLQISPGGQLQLPIAGSGAGVRLGGDVDLYRSAANEATLPDRLVQVSPAAGTVPSVVRGAAAQSVNLQEWQDSASAVLASISSAGRVTAAGGYMIGQASANPAYQAQQVAANVVLQNLLVGTDANPAVRLLGNGKIEFGAGGASPPDTAISRTAADELTIPDRLVQISPAAGTVASVVRGAASQAANLQEWQSSAGTPLAKIDSAGFLTSGLVAVDAGFTGSGQTSLVVKAVASQTSSNLIDIRNSASATLSRFDKNGYFMTRKTAAPADADLATSELAVWLDGTIGATKVMFKSKDSGGTVRTGSLALA